jgi:hypothetical protein
MDDFLSKDDWAAFSKLGAAAAKGLTGGPLAAPLFEKLSRRGYVSVSASSTKTILTTQGRAALSNWQRSLRS